MALNYSIQTITGDFLVQAAYEIDLTLIEEFAVNRVEFSIENQQNVIRPILKLEFHLNNDILSSISYDFMTKQFLSKELSSVKRTLKVGNTDIELEVKLNNFSSFP